MTSKLAQDKPAGKVKLTKAQREVLKRLTSSGCICVSPKIIIYKRIRVVCDLYADEQMEIKPSIVNDLLILGLVGPATLYSENRYITITPLGRRALKESSK